MITVGQTEARVRLSSTIMRPLTRALGQRSSVTQELNRDNLSIPKHCTEPRADMIFTRGRNKRNIIITHETNYINKWSIANFIRWSTDLTTIYLQTVTVNQKRHKYLYIKVSLKFVWVEWSPRHWLIVINPFKMVVWEFFPSCALWQNILIHCPNSVFKKSIKNEMFNQNNHIWPISTLVRITPIQWTNQSFPRRINLLAGAKGGKRRRALSKIGFSFASD